MKKKSERKRENLTDKKNWQFWSDLNLSWKGLCSSYYVLHTPNMEDIQYIIVVRVDKRSDGLQCSHYQMQIFFLSIFAIFEVPCLSLYVTIEENLDSYEKNIKMVKVLDICW